MKGNPAINKCIELQKQFLALPPVEYTQQFPWSLEKCIEDGFVSDLWFDLQGQVYLNGIPEEFIALDFEWVVVESPAPIIGTAVGMLSGKQYVWLSSRLDPMGDQTPKLCKIGDQVLLCLVHNVAADRPKVFEAHKDNSNLPPFFMCTSALHLLCAGAGGQQTWGFNSEDFKPYYTEAGALKNLLDTYNFWTNSDVQPEAKLIRNVFRDKPLSDIRLLFSELMDYSLKDPVMVAKLFAPLYKDYLVANPSEEGQYFAFKRGAVSINPIPNFEVWANSIEEDYQKKQLELNEITREILKEKALEFKKQIDLNLVDYTLEELPADMKLKSGKAVKKNFANIYKQNMELNKNVRNICASWEEKYPAKDWDVAKDGFPSWYSELDELRYGSAISQLLCDLSIKTDEGICQITYERGQKGRKFLYRRPCGEVARVVNPAKGPMSEDNCGSLFAKDYISLFENGVIYSENIKANKITKLAADLSYWTSVRARVFHIIVQKKLYENTK